MKHTWLFVLLSIPQWLFAHKDFKYWEHYTEAEKKAVLSQPDIYPDAVAFYYGKFQAGDDDRTFALLDTITNNKRYLAFHFDLLNTIVRQSDGALSEAMGEHCYQFTNNNPAFVLEYLGTRRMQGDTTLLQLYGSFIGHALSSATHTKGDYIAFKQRLENARKERNQLMPEAFSADLKLLVKYIEETIAEFNE